MTRHLMRGWEKASTWQTCSSITIVSLMGAA